MKRFRLIAQAASVLAAAALLSGSLVLSSCVKAETEEEDTTPVVLATPLNAAKKTTTETEASFKWDRVTGAFSYTAQLKLSTYGSVVKEIILEDPLNTVTFSGLESGTDYYFHVRANDKYSEGKNSYYTEWIKVTTVTVDPQYTPLDAPKNVISVASGTTTEALKFMWDVVENAVSYTYQLTDGADYTNMDVVTGALSVTIPALTPGVTYSFKVRANPAEASTTHRSSNYSSSVQATTIDQLAYPVVTLDAASVSASSLRFTWPAITGAASYVYQVAKGADDFGAEIPVLQNEVTLTTLVAGTQYYIKVKALPATGSTEYAASAYSAIATGKTQTAGLSSLSAPAPVQAANTASTITITWPAVTNATGYLFQLNDTSGAEIDTMSNLTSPVVVLSGTDASTATQIRVKAIADPGTHLDSDYSSWVTIAVAAAPTTIAVTTMAELSAALNDIADRGVITLAAGDYFHNRTTAEETLEINTLSITKSVTLRGPATTGNALPTARINAKLIKPSANMNYLAIENIEFTAYAVNATTGVPVPATPTGVDSYFIDFTSGSDFIVDTLILKNCYAHNITNAVVRATRGSTYPNVTHLEMTGNRFYNITGGNGGLLDTNGKQFKTNSVWIITNNTVTGINGNRLIRFSGVTSGTAPLTATIANNTFYHINVSTNNCIDCGSTTDNCGTMTIEKNIFWFAGYSAAPKGPRIGTGTVAIANNVCFVNGMTAGTTWGSLTPKDTAAPATTGDPFPTYTAGPTYQSYTDIPGSATFVPETGTNALTNRWGDSRWLPTL